MVKAQIARLILMGIVHHLKKRPPALGKTSESSLISPCLSGRQLTFNKL